MGTTDSPDQPSLPWRVGSSLIMGVAGAISRVIMFGANTTEVHGLDRFLDLLDQRRDAAQRERGLVTGLPFCAPEVDSSPANSRLQCQTISVCTYVSQVFIQ